MVRQTMCGCVHLYQKNQMELFSYCTKYKIMVPQGIPILRYRLLPTLATTTALHHHLLITRTHARRALHLAAASLYRRTTPTVEPTKEKATIKMDGCIDSNREVSSTKKKIHRNMKTVDSMSCWLALLYIIVSLFGLYPPITELPIGGSFDLHILQKLVNSGNQCFQLKEPLRYNRFEWGRRFVPNASLSLVPSLSPSSNLYENPNGNPVLSLDPSFNPWDFSSSTLLPRDDDNDDGRRRRRR